MSNATLHRRAAPPPADLTPGRRRVAVGGALVFGLLLIVALVAGLILAFTDQHSSARFATAAASPPPTTSGPLAGITDRQRQDALAAAPMPTLPAAAANPHGMLPSSTVPSVNLPAATAVIGLVPAGFPRTPAGAVAQLAAIDQTAIAGMNPAQVAQVYADWAVPGADPVELWSVTQFVRQTLNASGIPDGSSQLQANYTVTEAQVKGVIGSTFVLACVNGEFDASLVDNTVRIGAADCARMVWTGQRWQIGPGTQPANPPNAWPGSAEAEQVGWRPVTHG